jgi:hypothetical protein
MDHDPATPTSPQTSPPPVPVIEYDTPRADRVPRGKYVVMLVIAAVLGAILLGMLLYGVRGVRQARAVAATPLPPPRIAPTPVQTQATINAQVQSMRNSVAERRLNELLTNRLGPQTIVYEEEPVAAKRLRGDSSGVVNQQASRDGMMQPLWGAFEPPAYRASGFWENGVTNESPDALLFAHTLTSPGGNVRLVMLEMEVKLAPGAAPKDEFRVAINRRLKYRICETKLTVNTPQVLRDGTSLKIVQEGERNIIPVKWVDGTLRAARPKECNLRVFAGQPDPQDPSHFTVEYEIDGVKEVIDGWLTDDDFLRVVPRGGKVDKGNWQIDAAK